MTNPADCDPVLMAVVEALWDEMGMIADDATCMGMLYAALLSERHRAEEAKWLPIETAPKDGTQFVAAYPLYSRENKTNVPDDYKIMLIHWKDVWWDTGFWMLHAEPLAWMPIPAFDLATAIRSLSTED